MKWFGALLFISMTTFLGFDISSMLEKRPKHIRQLKSALQILEAEMLYSHATLQQSFELIAEQIPEPTKGFFEDLSQTLSDQNISFHQEWDVHLVKYIKKASLKRSEQDILQQFGRSLGQHNLTQQQKHIQLTRTYLDRELDEAYIEMNKYGKMTKSLGFLFGLFIILLLI